jgi:hypothetical protein
MESHDLTNVHVLEYYGLDNPPEGPGWKTVKCPFHTDSRASARSNGKGFICNGCGVRGDSLALIMERENIGYLDSVKFYEELTGERVKKVQHSTTRQRVSFDLSNETRHYERDGGLFSTWSSRDT